MLLNDSVRRTIWVLGTLFGLWIGVKYLLPALLPFGMGLVLALAAEPVVGFAQRHLGWKRGLAAGVGVSLTLLLITGLLSLVGALAVKELGNLMGALPDVEQTARQGMMVLQDWMVGLAQNLPEGARNLATGTVVELFDDGAVLLNQVTKRVPGAVSALLSWLPDGALGIGTGLLSGFMISARLPKIREAVKRKLPAAWKEKTVPALKRMGKTLGAWLKAQGKLMGVTFGILAAGLTVLRVRYGIFWALLIALVDAVPVLGTGTVLIPWAAVSLLRGEVFLGVGLLAVYAIALVTRTVLEPRLVGKQLGLDPLVTLLFFYLGYRFWGLLGMLLAPMLAAAAHSLKAKEQ